MTGNGCIPDTSPDLNGTLPTHGTYTDMPPTHRTHTGMLLTHRRVACQPIDARARFPCARHAADTSLLTHCTHRQDGTLVLVGDYYKGSEQAQQLILACPPPQ